MTILENASADTPQPNPSRRSLAHLWRTVPAIVLTILCFTFGLGLGGLDRSAHSAVSLFGWHITAPASLVLFLLLLVTVLFVVGGVITTRAVGDELAQVSERHAGPTAGSAVRLIVLFAGSLSIGLGVLVLLGVGALGLLIGIAVISVILSVAGQQILSNFAAGIVLIFTRATTVGQRVKIRSGPLGGPFIGQVVRTGMLFTLVDDDIEGTVRLPNVALMGSAIRSAPSVDSEVDHSPSAGPREESGVAPIEPPRSP